MLSVSIDELAKHSETISSELRAGHSLELLQGGKSIGNITPTDPQTSDEARQAAWEAMLAIMDEGFDLGGVPFTYEERHGR